MKKIALIVLFMTSGFSFAQTKTEKIKTFLFPVPDVEIQRHIISVLDRFDTLCNDLTSGLPAEIKARRQQYEHYRDRLLTFREAA